MKCVDDSHITWGEDILPRKQSEKRGRNFMVRKNRLMKPTLMDEAVKSDSGKFVLSYMEDSVNVALQ